MNWEKIKSEYPLAFKSCLIPIINPAWIENFEDFKLVVNQEKKQITFENEELDVKWILPYHRRLYDYFDRCGIFVNTSSIDCMLVQYDKGEIVRKQDTEQFKTRSEAEYAAFEIAFSWVQEILEKRVSEQENNLKIVK